MISRRLVRIKTLQVLYAFKQTGMTEVNSGKRLLEASLLAPFEVLLYLLEFPQLFHEFLESEKEIEQSKYYPDAQKIRDCNLFEHSKLANGFYNAAKKYNRIYFKNNWTSQADQFQSLFVELREQDFVRDYLVFDQPNLDQEKALFEDLYVYLINGCELFHSIMDDSYTAWNDDEELLLRELIRIVQIAKSGSDIIMPSKTNLMDEDIQFGLRMMELAILNGDELELEIEKVTDNWDPARIAILDLLCIKMALTEFVHFNIIPVKVTINEYLDISREYSTPGSSRFLNGILDKLRMLLENEGRILKTGRGLRDR
jgi:transcription antitermination protein NusB